MSESISSLDVTKKRPMSNHYTIRYALLGAAFGCVFPVVATIIVLYENGLPLSVPAIVESYNNELLLWIIATAPLFLGLFASIAGRREDYLQLSRRELEALVTSLEEQVIDKSRDLDRAVAVGHSVSQVSDLNELLAQAVELIRSSFELYYVQVYLPDSSGRNLLLYAGTGAVGRALISQRQRVPLGLGSVIGAAAVEKQTIIISDTEKSELFQSNPYLPETRSQIAMPLLIGENVIGILDMHADIPGKLSAANLPALEALAGQLAIAVEHTRLIIEATETRSEIELKARRMAMSGWQEFLDAVERSEYLGYVYESGAISQLEEPLPLPADGEALSVPIMVTGEPIGSIQVQWSENQSRSQDTEQLVVAVAEQVARQVESLRLLAAADRYRAEAEEASLRLTREAWKEYFEGHEPIGLGFVYDLNKVEPLTETGNGQVIEAPALTQALIVRGETIGQLEICGVQDLGGEAVEVVAAVAEQLSAHLEDLRLTEQTERALADTERQAKRLAALNDLSQALANAASIEDIYKAAAVKTSQIVPAERISIAILNEGGDRFEIFALHGDSGASKVGHVTSAEGTILFAAIHQNRVQVVNRNADSGIPGIESFMVAPLTAGGRTFGTLNAGSREPNVFDIRDESLLLQAASLLASTLESRRLFEETVQRAKDLGVISRMAQTRANDLAILNQMGQALTSLKDTMAVMETVYRHTSRLMHLESFYIALYDPEKDLVDITIFGQGEEIDQPALRRRAGQSITEYVIKSQKPLLIPTHVPERLEELGIKAHGRMAKSWLGVPMMIGDAVLGVIAVQKFNQIEPFNEHHRELLTAVANQAAIALENARLFEQVHARARREQILREITARVRNSADVDSVLRVAAKEVGHALGRQTFVYLDEKPENRRIEQVEEN